MTIADLDARCDAALAHLDAGTLLRDGWTDERDGRRLACLLSALSPEVAASADARDCPADIMPAWFARLTPWLNDAPSLAAWPVIVRRYVDLLRRSAVLTGAAWSRLDYRARRIAVLDARMNATPALWQVIDAVVALLDRAIAGDRPTADEWLASAAAASDYTYAYAAAAAYAAAYAAYAADASSYAAYAADYAAAVGSADDARVTAAAADRIATAILDAWHLEIEDASRRDDAEAQGKS